LSSVIEKNVLLNDLAKVRSFGMERYGSMKSFAKDLGISPQNLNSYLKGERRFGAKQLQRLNSIGFDLAQLQYSNKHNVLSDNTNIVQQVAQSMTPPSIFPDIKRACRLMSCEPADIARGVGADPSVGEAWADGNDRPTYDQLASLYHQVLALALHCCGEATPKNLSAYELMQVKAVLALHQKESEAPSTETNVG